MTVARVLLAVAFLGWMLAPLLFAVYIAPFFAFDSCEETPE